MSNQDPSDHPLEKAIRDFQDRITEGTFQGIYALDEASRDRVMECQARACVRAFAEVYQIPADLDLEEFLERMRLGGSSKIRIERQGNTLLWEEQHEGRCVCPLVTRGVIPLDAALCGCAIHWLRMLIERHTEGSVHVELLESAAQGSPNCVFRVTLPDPPSRATAT